MLRHFELELQTEEERIGLLKMRPIACWYFKNCEGANEFRNNINHSNSVAEVRTLIEEFRK